MNEETKQGTAEPVIVRQKDLPIPVIVVGEEGETVKYQLNSAGKRKVGACLGRMEGQ